jgi:hypothetical protein
LEHAVFSKRPEPVKEDLLKIWISLQQTRQKNAITRPNFILDRGFGQTYSRFMEQDRMNAWVKFPTFFTRARPTTAFFPPERTPCHDRRIFRFNSPAD